MLLALLAYAAAPDVAAYRAALGSGACADVRDDRLRDDCWLKWLDPADPAWCDRMATDRLRAECHFQAAEATRDATRCAQAAPFADDCRLHLLSVGFQEIAGPPGAQEAEVERRIVAAGMAADDPRPWSAWYRAALSASLPLDRAACDAVATEAHREACLAAGMALYHDRLNNARDRRTYPCAIEGLAPVEALPPALQYTPDPELDRARQHRRPDLCRR